MRYRNHPCSKEFHSCYIWCLFNYIYFSHIDVTFKSKVSGCSSKCNAVLTSASLSDKFFLSH